MPLSARRFFSRLCRMLCGRWTLKRADPHDPNPHEFSPPSPPTLIFLSTYFLTSYSHLRLGLPSVSFRFPYRNVVPLSLIFHFGHIPHIYNIFYICESTQYVWKLNICLGLPVQSFVIPKILSTVVDTVTLKYESLE